MVGGKFISGVEDQDEGLHFLNAGDCSAVEVGGLKGVEACVGVALVHVLDAVLDCGYEGVAAVFVGILGVVAEVYW